tara:strand:+ start:735 stop:842 length:108 start_codon:yes stop_codon:yes gene_type:complete
MLENINVYVKVKIILFNNLNVINISEENYIGKSQK